MQYRIRTVLTHILTFINAGALRQVVQVSSLQLIALYCDYHCSRLQSKTTEEGCKDSCVSLLVNDANENHRIYSLFLKVETYRARRGYDCDVYLAPPPSPSNINTLTICHCHSQTEHQQHWRTYPTCEGLQAVGCPP